MSDLDDDDLQNQSGGDYSDHNKSIGEELKEEIENDSNYETGSDDDSDGTSIIMSQKNGESMKVEKSQRMTPMFMTKYEKARIIGTRALQISRQAPVMVDLGRDDKDPIKIAEMELRQKKLPFIIRRHLPDGTYEDWDVNELTLLD